MRIYLVFGFRIFLLKDLSQWKQANTFNLKNMN